MQTPTRYLMLATALLCACGDATLSQPESDPAPGAGPAAAQTVDISITPASVNLSPGEAQAFTATVYGTAGVTMKWSVAEGAAGGLVTDTGSYVAPAIGGTYHVVATSAADPNSAATAVVTVDDQPTFDLGIMPTEASVLPGGTVQMGAGVSGVGPLAWSVVGGDSNGTVSASGVYKAPSTSGTYVVIASSGGNPKGKGKGKVVVGSPAVTVAVNPASASLQPAAQVALSATVSNSTNHSVTWSVKEGAGGGSVTTAGVYAAPATAGTYHVVATSVADPTASATSTMTVSSPAQPPAGVTVAVAPSAAAVGVGASISLTATVANSTNASVTWAVQEVAGGTVTASGVYTAPSTAGVYHVVATSVADPTASATASITVSAPPIAIAVSPISASLSTGATAAFAATVTNSANQAVTWSVKEGAAGGSVTSTGVYAAPSTAGTYHVVATSQADTTKTATATVTVTAPAPVSVAVTPTSASLTAGASQAFAAAVANSTNQTVTWTVQEGSAGGAVSSVGVYTAPSTAGTYHVVARSQADSSKSATASVTVTAPVPAPTPTPTPTPTPPPATVGAEYFVAVNGSDSNPGTLAQPFATLERAQTAVRALKTGAGIPANGVAVTLRGGIYPRTSTFTLTSADSGTVDRPVIYRAYPGETVRISGGRAVSGWTTVTSADPNWSRVKTGATLYRSTIGLTGTALIQDFLPQYPFAWSVGDCGIPMQAECSGAPLSKLAELIYDGQVMKLARWPKRVDDPTNSTTWLKATPGADEVHFVSGTSVTSRGWASVAGLPGVDKPWIHVNGNGYTDGVIQMIGADGTAISGAGPASGFGWGNVHFEMSGTKGRWAAVNLLEELTDQGEYWIDRTAGVVYFRPPGDANPAGHETVISALQAPLVSLTTTASYITIDGLIFEAGQTILMRVAGTYITVKNSTFRNGAASGVLVGNGYDTIDHNSFYDLVGGGVILVGSGAANMTSSGSHHATVSNNEIYRTGRLAFSHVPAISASGGTGHLVAHNYMHDIPGITLYGLSTGATIEYNIFQRVGTQGFDQGAYYSWGNTAAATTIRYNIFRDIQMNATYANEAASTAYCVVGLYADDNTAGVTAHSNIFYNVVGNPNNGMATQAVLSKNASNTFSNSVFSNVSHVFDGSGGTFSNDQAWSVTQGFPAGTTASATANPNFADPVNGDFSNQPDGTLVLNYGTAPIPASQIGIQR